MKTVLHFVLFTIVIVIFSLNANATTLRVGYNSVAVTGVDFTDFNSANAAATAGDTIQVYGSANGTSTKRLVIQGFGYNFDVHPTLNAIGLDQPSVLNLTINAGADSTIIEGVTLNAYTYSSKIVLRRCFITGFYLMNNTTSIDDLKVLDCVTSGPIQMYYSTGFECKNTTFYNSIINYYIYFYKPGSSGAIINCVTASPTIWGGAVLQLSDAGFLVKNSIIGYYTANLSNTVYESNLFYSDLPATAPLGSNNKWGLRWENIFQRLGGADDNAGYANSALFNEDYYQLKAGSPAIGAGTDASNAATNCGIYGGEAVYVYKLSGVPAIPSVYKLTAPSLSTSTNPYNVTISVRSNN